MANTPGQILREKREEMKLSLEQVFEGTNIRIHYLQAIEEDRLGSISSQAQLRGFIRLYASYLGLDPKSILEPVEVVSPVVDGDESIPGQDEPIDINNEKPALLKPLKKSATQQTKESPEIENLEEKSSTTIFKSIGQDLQRQREALGLSREDVERQIKIREAYLFALENGLVDDLPSTVQGRGMLNNYAAFMNLDPEPMQMKYAEGLQQRRIERAEEEAVRKKSPELKKYSAPITSWRRYLTPDLLIGSSVFIALFVLIIWGALQVIDTSRLQAKPTADSVTSLLVSTETPMVRPETATPEGIQSGTPDITEPVGTTSVDILSTINAVDSNSIQVVVVSYQRAFLRVISDGREVFNGRTVPGNVYPFTGSLKITLTTGNAAALQIYYNQQDLGVLGSNGQVLNLDFTSGGMATSTPQFTAIPTSTPLPTYTQRPTEIPTATNTPIALTITPLVP